MCIVGVQLSVHSCGDICAEGECLSLDEALHFQTKCTVERDILVFASPALSCTDQCMDVAMSFRNLFIWAMHSGPNVEA